MNPLMMGGGMGGLAQGMGAGAMADPDAYSEGEMGINPQMLLQMLGQADQPLGLAGSSRGAPPQSLGLLQQALLGRVLGQGGSNGGTPAPDDLGALIDMIRQMGGGQGMMPGMGMGGMPMQMPGMGGMGQQMPMGGPPGY